MTEIFFVFLIFGSLGVVLLFLNRWLGPRKTNPVKQTPFECGSPPLQTGIPRIPVKFYSIAFLFILFDIEVVFFFPWALSFRRLGIPALWAFFPYLGILLAGFVYAWKKGVFHWE
ncbi:MAG TPA: NADH-quinone oxidoreductase subunit A [Candidatus Aminicenantes bacterium]|nr:NADH-quinone oxidoreductase subunit A [Acidobacteriota bacterium]HOI45820.1 NADH-quinone oxidoreductase subunit A [Candidatus Aminicenantes bacterium]